ncbi:LptF/LptG family permease, partial [Candidatus Pelagibacter sp.]|nr:LptF/LptG family permease [Candidatus Pelagibacter sp.]
MKKILFRKLLFDYMGFFFIALLGSSIVVWVFQAVNFLDIMIDDGRDYLVYISYSLLNFPKIFSKLLPFVLFFSLFYVTSKYEYDNELIIFWNFGINKIQIVNFILKISVFLLLFQILLTSFIVPKSQDLARSFLRTSSVNYFGNFIKPQRFNDTIRGVTIYSEKKDIQGNLYNLFLKKQINSGNFEITYAKKGIFKEIEDAPLLVLYDGETITGKGDKITNFSFSKSDFSLLSLETNTTTFKKTQEVSTINILKCIISIYDLKYNEPVKENKNILNCTNRNIKNILKEFYKRLIVPLYIPILMMIPLILTTSSKENANYSKLRI